MIHIGASAVPLAARERFALDTLLDHSRILRTDDAAADVVQLLVHDEREPTALQKLAARSWEPIVTDGAVHLSIDVIRLVADFVVARDEQHTTAADRHDRVPSSANALVQQGLERSPVVSYAAQGIRRAAALASRRRIVRLLPAWPDGHRWAAALTHDLDVVQWWPVFTALRLAELLRSGAAGDAVRTSVAAGRALFGDPVVRAAMELLEVERSAGVRSTWFVLCGAPSIATFVAGDLTYRPDHPRTRSLLDAILRAHDEIGLHGSFATADDAETMRSQRASLRGLTGRDVAGVRQHFLRMRPPTTQRAMTAAGFSYDATFGFADRNGFRLGVADIVEGWDDLRGERLSLDLVPLAWMDRALSKYRGIQRASAWVDDALELAATCRDVEGLWVGLWHPNLTPALGYPDAPREYRRLVARLADEPSPYVATLDEMVRWRRDRRRLRAHRVAPDGRIEIEPASGITLFDETGRAVAL